MPRLVDDVQRIFFPLITVALIVGSATLLFITVKRWENGSLEVRMNPLLHRLAAQETTGLKAQPNMSASCKYT